MTSEVKTNKAPAAIGPYSQAFKAGDFLFVSGQIAIDPSTGKVIEGGIKEQTAQVINNIEAILGTVYIGTIVTGGHYVGLGDVVKTEVFLEDMGDFAEMNKIYASRFTHEPKPARQAIEAARLPLDVKVEISCIAYLGR